MFEIICGTNRPGSRSLELCQLLKTRYEKQGEKAQILDLRDIELSQMDENPYGDQRPDSLVQAVDRVNKARGLVVVCPEYNGSYPGVLKYFIDHWKYPESFESRPVCFVGLGGRFGALRPVEHLQGVFGYRNAYIFPERVFLSNIWGILKDGQINDETMDQLLDQQTERFCRFVKGLESQGLDANTKLKG
ncbi:MAG: NADPH-dependent FMN reductase [Pseudomonadota bacterium]